MSRLDFYTVLFPCIPCVYVLSMRGLVKVEPSFVLISKMTQQLSENSGLLIES